MVTSRRPLALPSHGITNAYSSHNKSSAEQKKNLTGNEDPEEGWPRQPHNFYLAVRDKKTGKKKTKLKPDYALCVPWSLVELKFLPKLSCPYQVRAVKLAKMALCCETGSSWLHLPWDLNRYDRGGGNVCNYSTG